MIREPNSQWNSIPKQGPQSSHSGSDVSWRAFPTDEPCVLNASIRFDHLVEVKAWESFCKLIEKLDFARGALGVCASASQPPPRTTRNRNPRARCR